MFFHLSGEWVEKAVTLPPRAGKGVYQLMAGTAKQGSRRMMIGLGLGGWAGLTAAAFCAGVEFGLQPILFHSASGIPLYAPYPLDIAVPAMVIPHALIAGVVEGLVTVLVTVYLLRTRLLVTGEFQVTGSIEPDRTRSKRRQRALWVALIALAAATPLGLLAPGTAWGEWSSKQ
jgi:cobalt/nickel transport system permease protein